jgi:hypothetical protein
MFVMLHVMITSRCECRVHSFCMTVIQNFVVGYKQMKNSQTPSTTHTLMHTQQQFEKNFSKKFIGQ